MRSAWTIVALFPLSWDLSMYVLLPILRSTKYPSTHFCWNFLLPPK